MTASLCGSLQTHLGTLMPSGGGHIINATRTYDRETGERLHDRTQFGGYTRDGSFA